MDTAIVVAIISGLCVGIPSLIATVLSNSAFKKLIVYRIDQLEVKVNKHNSIVERTYKLEQAQAVLNERINSIEDN